MLSRRLIVAATAALVALTFVACQDGGVAPDDVGSAQLKKGGGGGGGNATVDAISAMMDQANAALAAEGSDYRVAIAEYVTGEGDEAGATVISKDVGNKQLAFDFVPFDPRRVPWSGPVGGPTDDITYAVDQVDAVPPLGVLTATQTTAAIDAAMGTWDGQTCSDLPITRNPDFGLNLGVLQGGALVADVMHAGWGDFFVGGVLGAAFTFAFCAPCAPPTVFTDIDNNKKGDTAWREIFYDGFFPTFPTPWPWNVDGTGIDVEAVALHEAGHGLSQAHFGNIFFKNDGSVKRAPAAVMNPFILGATRTLLGTDNGGHCSNWAQWPNN